MDDNTIDVEVVPVEIVRCSRCGARNRLLKQKTQVTYRCGGCAAPLKNPFVEKAVQKRGFRGIIRKVSASHALKYLVGIVITIVVMVMSFSKQRNPPSPVLHNSFTPPLQVVEMHSQPAAPPLEAPARQSRLLETPAAPPKSLENGTILAELETLGHSRFVVRNSTDRDAVVKLVDATVGHTIAAVYVTANSSATIDELPEGSFAVLYSQGVDWDDNSKTFRRKKSFGKFDQNLDFIPKLEEAGPQIIRRYHYITLELAPSVDGNMTKADISEEEFSKY